MLVREAQPPRQRPLCEDPARILAIVHHAQAEKIGTLLFWLCQAVAGKMAAEQLSCRIIQLIIARIQGIKQAIDHLGELLGSGRFFPRRSFTRRASATPRKPPEKTPLRLQKFGWLLAQVPEAVGARSQLDFLLRDPEFAAFIAAAPKPLIRRLRSLCWMLRLEAPAILAVPRRERPPRPAPTPRAAKASPPPPPDRPGFGKLSHPKWPKLPGPRYPKRWD